MSLANGGKEGTGRRARTPRALPSRAPLPRGLFGHAGLVGASMTPCSRRSRSSARVSASLAAFFARESTALHAARAAATVSIAVGPRASFRLRRLFQLEDLTPLRHNDHSLGRREGRSVIVCHLCAIFRQPDRRHVASQPGIDPRVEAADAVPAPAPAARRNSAAMVEIGKTISYRGRLHTVVGATPMGATPWLLELEAPRAGAPERPVRRPGTCDRRSRLATSGRRMGRARGLNARRVRITDRDADLELVSK
jgi:hypothetical protein